MNAAGLEPSQRALEVGCGPGFFTIPAAKIVGKKGNIYALDINPLAIERVKEKIKIEGATNIETILADAAQTDLPDQSFDLVFLFNFTRPIGQRRKIWIELYRVLKTTRMLSIEGQLRPPNELFQPLKRQGRIYQYRKVDPSDKKDIGLKKDNFKVK